MTDTKIPLADLMAKADDGDFLRSVAESVLQILMEADVEGMIGASRLKRLLTKQGCPPRRMITDKPSSYAAARREVMPTTEHRLHKGLNNRAENSHLPLRR